MTIGFNNNICTFAFSDTANNKVDSDRMAKEIIESQISYSLDMINTNLDTQEGEISFRGNLTINDQDILTIIIQTHTGEPLVVQNNIKFDAFGNALFATAGVGGIKETFISFDWGDKHTWYQNSIRVENEVMEDSGNHQIYNLTTPKMLIDVTHWRLSDESWKPSIKACKPIVKVDNVAYVENYISGNTVQHPANGYDIDYDTGNVYFNVALTGTEEVTISYSKLPETNLNDPYGTRQSAFILKAPVGHRITLNRAEIQWDWNLHILDTVRFIPYYEVGKDPEFDYFLGTLGLGALPPGYELPIPWLATLSPALGIFAGYEKAFNSMSDFTDDADGYYVVDPIDTPVYVTDSLNRFDETGTFKPMTRDQVVKKKVQKWNYQGNENMTLDSGKGQYIKLFLANDNVFTGGKATATLYGTKYKID